MGSERLPAVSTIRLLGCLACFCAFACFALVCLNIALPFIQLPVIACEGYIRLLIKLPLKFRNVFEHTEIRSSFACNQNIKEDISTALEVFICFETKRNETKPDPQRKHPRNVRVISAEELGTMSKNNLRGITLVRGPIWGIHSFTLIISCLRLIYATIYPSDFLRYLNCLEA